MNGMKKLCLATLVFSLAFGLSAIEATVVSVAGKVQVLDGALWKDVKAGDILKKGDVIQTGFKSEAVIALASENENSRITVSQLSRLTVEQLAEHSSGDRTSVYLSAGSVKSEIKKTEDHRANYTVRSPIATAAVRGTELTVTHSFLSTKIDTHTGVVETYRTPKAVQKPIVVSEENTDADKMLFEQRKTVSVRKGQSVRYSPAHQTSTRESAALRTSMLNGSTASIQQTEAVLTALAAEHSYPVRTSKTTDSYGNISVGAELTDSYGDISVGVKLTDSYGNISVEVKLQ